MSEPLLERALVETCRELERRGIEFSLVGGLAVSLRARIRFTRDIDLAVALGSDADVERLVRDLQAAGYRVKALVEQDAVSRIATVRLIAPAGVVVDLLVASSGIEAELVMRAGIVPWNESLSLRVARNEELLALKVLSMSAERPQDRADALAIRVVGVDEETVLDNLRLIEARGFHRNQDLLAKYRSL